MLVLALAFPIEELAEASSRITLIIFAFLNAALLKLKIDDVAEPAGAFVASSVSTDTRACNELALSASEIVLRF